MTTKFNELKLVFSEAFGTIPTFQEVTKDHLGFFETWSIAYGCADYTGIYYIYFYPPFDVNPSWVSHYDSFQKFANDVKIFKNFNEAEIPTAIATVYALLTNKESFELTSTQKLLKELGLNHYSLDQYYQDTIKNYVDEAQTNNTIFGKSLNLNLLENKWKLKN